MSATHTPGPWEIMPGNTYRHPYHVEGGGWTVATIVANQHRDGDDDANARLIAAAPDLLNALWRAMLALGRAGANVADGPYRDEWEAAQTALRKAVVCL